MDVVKKLAQGALGLAFLFQISPLDARDQVNLHSENTYIIKLRSSASSSTLSTLNFVESLVAKQERKSLHQAKKIQERSLGKAKSLFLKRAGVIVAEGLSSEELRKLGVDPDVAYVEKNILWQHFDAGMETQQPSSESRNPWLQDLLGFEDSIGQTNTPSSQQVIVAVIDSGTRIDHPFLSSALFENSREMNGAPGVDDDGNGFVDDTIGANAITKQGSANESFSSHGTHVSGLVKVVRDLALHNNPEAAQVSVLPIRFIGDNGSGSTAAAIAALEYAAAMGASVVNASWGSVGYQNYSQALYETFARLYEDDIVFTVAAGNASSSGPNNNDQTPTFPANFNIPSLISVASVTPHYARSFQTGEFGLRYTQLSSFSNYGVNSVHIAAPGDYSNQETGEFGSLSAYSGYGPWGNLYIRKQGTSMAAPVVAGIAGVIRAINPSLSAYDVKKIIINSAVRESSLEGKIETPAIVHAVRAFASARGSSAGNNPSLPSSPIRAGTQSDEEERQPAPGCGSIAGAGGGGPLSGNSIGLLLLCYFVLIRFKKRQNPLYVGV